jgi:hypothetical protein
LKTLLENSSWQLFLENGTLELENEDDDGTDEEGDTRHRDAEGPECQIFRGV